MVGSNWGKEQEIDIVRLWKIIAIFNTTKRSTPSLILMLFEECSKSHL
jgi:hypothetical protein